MRSWKKLVIHGLGISLLAHWVVLDLMREPSLGTLGRSPLQATLRRSLPAPDALPARSVMLAERPVASKRPAGESVPARQVPRTPSAPHAPSATLARQPAASAPPSTPGAAAEAEAGLRPLSLLEAQVAWRIELAHALRREAVSVTAPVTVHLQAEASSGQVELSAAPDSAQARALATLLRRLLASTPALALPAGTGSLELEFVP